MLISRALVSNPIMATLAPSASLLSFWYLSLLDCLFHLASFFISSAEATAPAGAGVGAGGTLSWAGISIISISNFCFIFFFFFFFVTVFFGAVFFLVSGQGLWTGSRRRSRVFGSVILLNTGELRAGIKGFSFSFSLFLACTPAAS
jgi:hypothetical protein